mgnify:CR=1 FL=1|jgi:hypothetical protein
MGNTDSGLVILRLLGVRSYLLIIRKSKNATAGVKNDFL